jgi:hypothetical protein
MVWAAVANEFPPDLESSSLVKADHEQVNVVVTGLELEIIVRVLRAAVGNIDLTNRLGAVLEVRPTSRYSAQDAVGRTPVTDLT